jgi:transposase
LERHAEKILAVVADQPDLTLHEIVMELRKQRIRTSQSAVARFFERHDITFKKKPAGGGAAARRRGPSAQTLDSRARHA